MADMEEEGEKRRRRVRSSRRRRNRSTTTIYVEGKSEIKLLNDISTPWELPKVSQGVFDQVTE